MPNLSVRRPPWNRIVGWLITTVAVMASVAVLNGGSARAVVLVSGLLCLLVGVYVVAAHPALMRNSMAVLLGAAPFARFPVFPAPVLLALGGGVILAALVHRAAVTRVSTLEAAVAVLVVVSALSVYPNAVGGIDLLQFSEWLIATAVMFALLRLPVEQLATVGRMFAYGAAAGAVYGLVNLYAGGAGPVAQVLVVLGYTLQADTSRYVFTEDDVVSRLAGSFIDPNAAGIFLFVALLVCIVTVSGPRRWVLAAVIGVGLTLTLSRAAFFSLVVGVVLVLLFQRMNAGRRVATICAAVIAAALTLTVPRIRDRLFASFGAQDIGSSARSEAFEQYTTVMDNRWLFGLGWGRPEFFDADAAFETNVVANSPLLAVYRGGIFTGLAFCLVIGIGIAVAYRCLRSTRWESGIVGGGFVGFTLVALQLDYPVVTIPQVTLSFSVLLTFLVYAQRAAETAGVCGITSMPESLRAPRDAAGSSTAGSDARG
ncbi:O-antigen ligase family protein [Rhodococcus tibetensis]|uniref:O-antigen ligase domain-containing protein n=1 Tax=Rhodococcus tibetensis TaxID=2965064 RepID=A0ABT1QF31_9NOCA|nr:O-antigen ligase family protein [Rhodococcus sp. FXJ9.536]MCQ4120894.1 O-antigen ligase domain-containing protein [Rhodococcus sp. FXJ9.536]